jgi:hypothetical protein
MTSRSQTDKVVAGMNGSQGRGSEAVISAPPLPMSVPDEHIRSLGSPNYNKLAFLPTFQFQYGDLMSRKPW